MILESIIRKKTFQEKEELEKWMKKHNKEVSFPDTVREIKNISYIKDESSCHQMDVYCPKNADRYLPVIVNVHGGGLLMGSKELNRLFCMQMCEMGFVVFCIEYPLVPEAQVYQLFSDINAAMDMIDGLLDDYRGDREHVYLVGDSAGAYLITYVAAMQRCKAVAKAAHVRASRLPVKALGLISGMFYTHKLDSIGIFLTSWIYGKNWRHHPFRPYMNPEHPDIVSNLPPCFLVTAGGDNLRHYTLQFYKALRKNGGVCRIADYRNNKNLEHAFSAMRPELEESREANKNLAEYLLQF